MENATCKSKLYYMIGVVYITCLYLFFVIYLF